MARDRNRNRDRKSRITIDMTPEAIRARREAAEDARLRKEDRNRREAAKPENWGPADIRAGDGVVVSHDPKTGKIRGMWRTNPFTALSGRETITQEQANAGQDYLRFYAASKGLEGPPETVGLLDHTREWSKEDRRQYHIRLVALINNGLSTRTRQLIDAYAYALIEEDRPLQWRGIIERELRESDPAKQVARFQVMCEELVDIIPEARKALKGHYDRKAA